MAGRWRISIDTGGTFTDVLAVAPDGTVRRAKVLSRGGLRARVVAVENSTRLRLEAQESLPPGLLAGGRVRRVDRAGAAATVRTHGADGTIALDAPIDAAPGVAIELVTDEPAPVLGARLVTGTPPGAPLPPLDLRLGTTWGTNALLERRVARSALVTTRGFADVLAIGDQQRPDLFALEIRRPAPLPEVVLEVDERLAADGTVLRALGDRELDRIEAAAADLVRSGITAAAVALLHAYRDPRHEQAVAARLRRAGMTHVAEGAALAPLIRLLPRAETAAVDAALGPVVTAHLRDVDAALGGAGRVLVMTSAGGLSDSAAYRACDSLLSGPAGGVVGARDAGRRAGFERVIGFDMGGTSTDASRIDGAIPYVFEHRVGGVRVLAPAVDVETVAAGGGSICEWRDGALRVGPRSAGAVPGPACYGAGGPLTLTDVNLLAGRLDPARFEIPIDEAAAAAALAALRRGIEGATGRAVPADELLDGLRQIADERMGAAIAAISVARGIDPADHALVGFGGAGGQHALAVAERLGIGTVLLPADASILSAAGIAAAAVERLAGRQVLAPLADVENDLPAWIEALRTRATDAVAAAGADETAIAVRRVILSLRLRGQESTIDIDDPGRGARADAFARAYEMLHRFPPDPAVPLELESIRVLASASGAGRAALAGPAPEAHAAASVGRRRARFGGAWRDVPVFDRAALRAGAGLSGPALLFGRGLTEVLEPGWSARLDADGTLRCARTAAAGGGIAPRAGVVRDRLFANRFVDLVTEAGRVLERTALSTNVKHRLDFSCGLLDPAGRLVANAPHIPVHLGALGPCVRAVRSVLPLDPGDVAVVNHPGFGGSHLPDVTVITPVFADDRRTRLGFVASRAHHAEIGGRRPGSMPPEATRLAEEGVVIEPMLLRRAGVNAFDAVEARLRDGPWPSRAVRDNLADLRAQVAANERASDALRGLAGAHGVGVVLDAMAALRHRAAALVRAALAAREDGRFEAAERLDDGTMIRVAVEITGDRARLDFTGTGCVHEGNLNATPAIVASAVTYVMRLLLAPGVDGGPLNEGLLEPVELVVPAGSLLDPPFGGDPAAAPAVVGGNTETSQRIVEALVRALGLLAGSQGTMNNVLFGDDAFGYYETIAGGAGAGPTFAGADAVHVHMTNTRMTDVELLEHRHPVRVERFAVRRGSGGAGRHRGGDGVVRELSFLAPLRLSVLTQRRTAGAPGADGGGDGAPGRQVLHRADGRVETLASIDGRDVEPGDRLVIETPGGGAWGWKGLSAVSCQLSAGQRAAVSCARHAQPTSSRRGPADS